MKIEQAKTILCAVLECGWLDLQALEKIERDFEDIIEYVNGFGENEKITLSNLLYANFQLTLQEVEEWKDNKIEELEENLSEDSTEEQEEKIIEEIDELKALEPLEDFETFINFIDTHIWFRDNSDTYEKYQDELESIFDKCGYSPF